MKKVIALLFAFLLTAGLVACSSNSDDSSVSSNQEGAASEIEETTETREYVQES